MLTQGVQKGFRQALVVGQVYKTKSLLPKNIKSDIDGLDATGRSSIPPNTLKRE